MKAVTQFIHTLKYSFSKINSRSHCMRKAILAVICTVFVFGTIVTGHAAQGDWRGEIRSRIQVSKQKIEQGVKRGTLDRHEADKLNAELGTILNKIDRMKADGYLNQKERNKVNSDLDKLDRDIFKEKHDAVSKGYAAQGDWRGGIRSRIQVSNQKIEQGLKRGTLSGPEAYRLRQELGTILLKINYMKADGYLNKRERDKVNSDLDKLDKEIYKEKHDTVSTGHAAQGDWRGEIRSRIQKSKQKIEQGIERGTLNRHEADKLNAELGTILNKIDRMKADGYLSQGEHDRIKRDLDRLDKDIYKEKRDDDRRH
jgi:outer membrane murein-binding lipoprotein Lpp